MALSRTHQLPIKAGIENPCMGKDGRLVHAVYEVRGLLRCTATFPKEIYEPEGMLR